MPTPTHYGSENEDTAFIVRIAETADGQRQRRQKMRAATRLTVLGATIGLVAASAVLGYSAMHQGQEMDTATAAVPSQELEAALPVAKQYVTPLDDSYYPSLEQLDTDHNKIVSQTEYLTYLVAQAKKDEALVRVKNIPEEIKTNLIQQIEANLDHDGNCAITAFKKLKSRKIVLNEKNIIALYQTLDQFCPTNPVVIPQELIDKYAQTTSPPTEPTTTAPATTEPVTTTAAPEPATTEPAPTTPAPVPTEPTPTTEPVTTPTPTSTEPMTTTPPEPATTEPTPTTPAPVPTEPTPTTEPVTTPTPTVPEPTTAGPTVPATTGTPIKPQEIDEPDDTVKTLEDLNAFKKDGWLTRDQFQEKLQDHFAELSTRLKESAKKAEDVLDMASKQIDQLKDCIKQGTDIYAPHGAYVKDTPSAVEWIKTCLPR